MTTHNIVSMSGGKDSTATLLVAIALEAPNLHTVFADIVTIKGTPYVIVDIGMHMLTPRQLYRAQGFPDNYVIDRGHDGRKFSNKTQVMMVGNSVSPWSMMALVSVNIDPADDDLIGVAA